VIVPRPEQLQLLRAEARGDEQRRDRASPDVGVVTLGTSRLLLGKSDPRRGSPDTQTSPAERRCRQLRIFAAASRTSA
jgi:hypothetical protein